LTVPVQAITKGPAGKRCWRNGTIITGTPVAGPGEAPSTLEAALAYLALGWSVIPAPVGAKRSLVAWKGWQATQPPPETWRAWAKVWPRANLAVITGRLSGVVVLDVDPRHGGLDSLARLEREHGELPETATVLTPSGGRHVYYTHPGVGRIGNVQNSAAAPGLDLRGDGGLALLPPSRRADGQAYEWWMGPDELAPLPGWLVASLHPPAPPRDATRTVATIRPAGARTAARWDAVMRHVHQAPEGSRNSILYWGSCRLAELAPPGPDRDQLAGDLEDLAVARGLPRAEAQRTITSGLAAEIRP
jgi:hypothetical protein